MTTITLENVPSSFQKKFGKRMDFNDVLWIYWDGMDWCQYDEVIPSESDILARKEYKKNLWEQSWYQAFKMIIRQLSTKNWKVSISIWDSR